MGNGNSSFDIGIICAMPEEAEAFIQVVKQKCGASFARGFSERKREYRYTTIHNNQGEPLTLFVSWLPRYGLLETGLHLTTILQELAPRFAGMTGICAGDKRKVALGDLVVAERAFIADNGKIVTDKDGQKVHEYDTYTAHMPHDILQFVRMFTIWKEDVVTLPRPPSKRQQRDWLLCQLLEDTTPSIDDIERETLTRNAPSWRSIIQKLQTEPSALLTQARSLRSKLEIEQLHYGADIFPFIDPPQANCHIAPMGSCNTVRSDNPFNEIRTPVRGTISVDMEGAAFYRAIEDFPMMRSLVVKGVSDYADNEKDDSYHAYASLASALYMLSFIREYVTSQLMPPLPDEELQPTQQKDTISAPSGLAQKISIGIMNAEIVNFQQGRQITNMPQTSSLRKEKRNRDAR